MKLKNKYQKFSKISEPQFRQILRLFALDLTASDTARLTGISVRSINTLFLKLRQRLAAECEQQTPFDGVVELDESYFGAKRIRGKRGRGAGGKTIVFGVLKRGDKVYTEIVSDAPKATLQKVIRGHISIESVINTDGWRGYHGLIDMGFAKHFRVYCKPPPPFASNDTTFYKLPLSPRQNLLHLNQPASIFTCRLLFWLNLCSM